MKKFHRSVNEFLGNLQRQGINPDMYFQNHWNYSKKIFTNNNEGEAESRTKTNLVIEAVAKAEGFDASEEEIQKRNRAIGYRLQHGSCTSTKLAFS